MPRTDRGGVDVALKAPLWHALLKLAERGAFHRRISVSTIALAGDLGVSQQTASRYVIALDRGGYLERQASAQGHHLQLTDKGRRVVEGMYRTLRRVVDERPPALTFKGKVVNGLGEGAYYMSQQGYRDQFSSHLGFIPFPGTLNLRLDPDQEEARRELETRPAITIHGFREGTRTFGEVRCYPAIINGRVEGAVTLIHRTHHDDSIIEVIAPTHLRRSLGLEEGSDVTVTLPFTR